MNKRLLIEAAATAAPFAVAQFADKKFIVPAAVIGVVGIAAYNYTCTPNHQIFSNGHATRTLALGAEFAGGVWLAYNHPAHGLLIGAATLAAMYLTNRWASPNSN